MNAKKTTTSATAAAAAKISKAKKPAGEKVSHAKREQAMLPLEEKLRTPEIGMAPLKMIIVAAQVRKEFDQAGIEELAKDLVANGMLQPLVVRPHPTKTGFELVAGERRLRAAQLAGFDQVPVIVKAMDDQAKVKAQFAENIQRQELSLKEEADLLAKMHEEVKSVSAVAKLVSKSVAWVSKRISLAEGLGHYAAGLMADGITEDIELLQCVDKLDKATPGTNAAWALCEKIRKGEAGRTEAREALKRVIEERKAKKVEPTQETKTEPVELIQSQHFRYWLKHETPWFNEEYMPAVKQLVPMMQRDYDNITMTIKAMETELDELKKDRLKIVKKGCQAVVDSYSDKEIHEAYLKIKDGRNA